jgi:hypothetical protein
MNKPSEQFEQYYAKTHPNDKCTMMSNGNYSGWIKQQLWEQWQHRQAEIDEANSKAQMCRDEKNHAITRWGEISKQFREQGERFNAQNQQIASLKWQLERLGYTDNGGEMMKPPIGQPPTLLQYLDKCEETVSQWPQWKRDQMRVMTGLNQPVFNRIRTKHFSEQRWSKSFPKLITTASGLEQVFADMCHTGSGMFQIAAEGVTHIEKGARVYVSFDIVNYVIKDGNSHGELDGKFEGYGIVDRFEDGRVYGRREDGLPFSCMLDGVKMIFQPKSANQVALEQLEYELGVAPNDNNPMSADQFENLYMCSWDLASKDGEG